MSIMTKRLIILAILIIVGIVLLALFTIDTTFVTPYNIQQNEEKIK